MSIRYDFLKRLLPDRIAGDWRCFIKISTDITVTSMSTSLKLSLSFRFSTEISVYDQTSHPPRPYSVAIYFKGKKGKVIPN